MVNNLSLEKHNDNKLINDIKLLCLIYTHSKNHQTKAISVKETWSKHCDKSIFFTNSYDTSLSSSDGTFEVVVFKNYNDTYENLWQKTRLVFTYAYDNYFTINNEKGFDWFLKADDDTFVIIENLKMFLRKKNSNKRYYFGCRLKSLGKKLIKGFMSGGAGYVLSRGSIEKLVTEGFRNTTLCNNINNGFEDVEMGWCLQKLNIFPSYINNEKEILSFFPSKEVILHIFDIDRRNTSKILRRHMYDKLPKKKIQSMPKYPISFHYITPTNMYLLDYLFYKAKVDDNE
uniref:N-acetylgalactosaminide beta-1,3-galactosyltransferase n=1 Tax=Strongyloides stercoralis TaxID=6248 RepID=A0AAF5I0T0_STRER